MIKGLLKKILKKGNRIDKLEKLGLKIDSSSKITCYSPEGIDGIFPWLISIGKNTIISTNCTIVAHDASLSNICGYSKIGCVDIGNNVYLGTGVTVLPGVSIGDNVIVGAKSLVTKSLEPNCVYAGVPAKKICSLDEYISKHEAYKKKSIFFENNFLYYSNCSQEERNEMKKKLENNCGYIKSRKNN